MYKTSRLKSCKGLALGLSLTLFSVIPVVAYSGTGVLNIAAKPLFSSTAVDPNVFFVVDDSETMQTDQMTPYLNNGGLFTIGTVKYPFIHWIETDYHTLSEAPDTYSTLGNHDPSVYPVIFPALPSQQAVDLTMGGLHEDSSTVWRARNSEFNKIYYDHNVTYEPWEGVNSAGTAYGYITTPTAVPWDPYENAGTTVDLTTEISWDVSVPDAAGATVKVNVYGYYIPRYYIYSDTNENGAWDTGESYRLIEIASMGTSSTITPLTAYVHSTSRTDCGTVTATTATCTYGEEMQNFATWWAYHRTRSKVMKSVLASVVKNSAATRMGMATAHNDSQRREIADMDTAANKTALLSTLFQYRGANSGSPLSAGLERAGNYYACGGSAATVTTNKFSYSGSDGGNGYALSGSNLFGNSNCPILTSANGGACQQNFTVLLTDGLNTATNTRLWYLNNSIPGGAFTGSPTSSLNLYLDNKPFQNGGTPNNSDGDTTNKFAGGAYADTVSDTLADVAMHFYKTDLSTLDNKVPTQVGTDENDQQHMVTYVVGLIEGDDLNLPDLPTDDSVAYPYWQENAAGNMTDAEKGAMDIIHATYNSRGGVFVSGSSYGLSTALDTAVSNIADRVGSASAVAFNTTTLSTKTEVYLALFNSTRWSGDLNAYKLDPNTGEIEVDTSWRAGDILTNSTTPSSRKIYTYNADTYVGQEFAYSNIANLSAAHKADLGYYPTALTTAQTATLIETRMNYLRGDRSTESSGYSRARDSVLGDIVHSGPVYVGVPNLQWADDGKYPQAWDTANPLAPTYDYRYSAFKAKYNATPRTNAVYVGSNDGMLHAFNADTGSELFAYIPNAVFSSTANKGLHYLTDTSYQHQYYVDLTPTLSDVFNPDSILYSATGATLVPANEWYTILVGGLRGGGAALYALNVTDPDPSSTFDASKIMFEFDNDASYVPEIPASGSTPAVPATPHTGDPDLGYTFSKPVVAMTNATNSSGSQRWAIIVGNGYNPTGPGANGRPALYIIFLDPDMRSTTLGQDLGWTVGKDYIKLQPAVDDGEKYGNALNPNGLSTPTLIDMDGDGSVDRVYAGDYFGNMWAYDLSSTTASTWDFRFTTKVGGVDEGRPLFTASTYDSVGLTYTTLRPITSAPAVSPFDSSPTATLTASSDLVVLFGTGQYMEANDADPSIQDAQAFYSVYDIGTKELVDANLTAQTLSDTTSGGTTYRTLTSAAITNQGCYIPLPVTGERVVTNPVVRDKIVYFNTTTPSSELCSSGGSGWLMSVNYIDCAIPAAPVFDINDDGVVDDADKTDTNGDGVVDENDTSILIGKQFNEGLPSSSTFLGNRRYTPGTETSSGADVQTDAVEDIGGPGTDRLSWEELKIP